MVLSFMLLLWKKAMTRLLSILFVLSASIAIAGDALPKYDRGLYRHWVDEDGDCQDARQEALIEESIIPVKFSDNRDCVVKYGKWYSPYDNAFFTDPKLLDVDHVVALGEAHASGGYAWSREKRQEYANYLKNKDHLIVVSATSNRSKGKNTPETWLPPYKKSHCKYASNWKSIKDKWELSYTTKELDVLQGILSKCLND